MINITNSFLDVNNIGEFEKLEIEQRKTVIYNFLAQKKHPLLFLDNSETFPYILNDKRQQYAKEQYVETANISNYLNNNLPANISVLVTSREKNKNFGNKERRIDLESLQKQESIELFSGLISEDFLKTQKNMMNNTTAKEAFNKIYEITGGHPLSIEIIAKNTSSIFEMQELANTLGLGIVNPDELEKRVQSLEASFDYTINRLPDNTKKLLYELILFKSPFSINISKDL